MGYFLAKPVIIILLLFASELSPLSARSPLHRLDALVNDGGEAVTLTSTSTPPSPISTVRNT